MKKYFRNDNDPYKPVYEVDYLTKTWKLYSTAGHMPGDVPDIHGKVRPTSFTSPVFAEVSGPAA